ncbi:respiratory chain complex I subunit 1 family protein [Sulfoacidibacillus thermotolerans]|nr:NADH-quinone oxidoreductase subunit H [Sulfoacidibacillus thermotolerans]
MSLLQACFIVLFAPFLQGVIKRLKARMQGRTGPSIWQPYRELRKYFHKGAVVSDQASIVTRLVPYGQFALIFSAALTLPLFTVDRQTLLASGNLFLFIYLLGFARLLTALLGMDSGSAFGGMGVSRDLFVALLVEPTVFLAILSAGLLSKGFSFAGITLHLLSHPGQGLTLTTLLAAAALLMIVITETGRLPIDNPDTHLELTMIHEGAILDLSGRALGLMSLGAWMKQLLWISVFFDTCLPYGMATDTAPNDVLYGVIIWVGKVLLFGVVLAFIESVTAKMRLFTVPRFLTLALSLSLFALLSNYVGA